MSEGGDNPQSMTTAPEPPAARAGEAISPSELRTAAPTNPLREANLLGHRQLRKLRMHEEEFAQALAARLSGFLRAEVSFKIAAIEIVPYHRLISAWSGPCHLGLFKTEPLRGISILHLPMPLGLNLVDRMMGGPGKAPENAGAEMSEIEKALLDQLTQIVLEEWCANWASIRELKPVALGSETNSDFLQTAPPETNMLTLSLHLTMGETKDRILLAIPHPALEPLIRQLAGDNTPVETVAPAQSAPGVLRWNPSLNEVKIGLTAEWQGLELSAREILNLKLGDVVPLDAERAASVVVRLGDVPKFNGRLGAVADKWAVELAQAIKT
jgi:flagellar motor switch protein FliM